MSTAISALTATPSCPSDIDKLAVTMFPSAMGEELVGLSRAWATGLAETWGMPGSCVDALEQVVSELVTNSLVHTTGALIGLALARDRSGTLWLEVRDQGGGDFPDLRMIHHDPIEQVMAEHGRGMFLVAAFSSNWGVQLLVPGYPDQGHLVWASFSPETTA